MKTLRAAVLLTGAAVLAAGAPLHAWWPGTWSGGYWNSGMWSGGATFSTQAMLDQQNQLRSVGLQQGQARAQQLRSDQQAEGSRFSATQQQWAATIRHNQDLQYQVDASREYQAMRQEYLAQRDRPVTPQQASKRHQEWVQSIRNQIRVAYSDLFTPAWNSAHPPAGAHVWFDQGYPYQWWSPATWQALTGWVVGSWGEPMRYDFGSNVVIKDGAVFINGKQVSGAADFAAHAIAIAAAGAQALAAPREGPKPEWMPLGVFALTSDDKSAPTMLIQLAVDKNGILAGTYYNLSTDEAKAVEGALDRATQRAAWAVAGQKETVVEAGVFNLTQGDLPVLIHFGTAGSQRWQLTRMVAPGAAP
jgi:hypothetical protein